jgi:hypothetical protein
VVQIEGAVLVESNHVYFIAPTTISSSAKAPPQKR